MTDLEQLRASSALKYTQRLKELGYSEYGNYVSFVKTLPAVILQNGLGQALATELAASTPNEKGKENDTHKGHKHLCKIITSWLGRIEEKVESENEDYQLAPYPASNKTADQTIEEYILQAIMDGTQEEYIYAQHEAIAYIAWLKKFAVAMLDQEPITGKPNNE